MARKKQNRPYGNGPSPGALRANQAHRSAISTSIQRGKRLMRAQVSARARSHLGGHADDCICTDCCPASDYQTQPTTGGTTSC